MIVKVFYYGNRTHIGQCSGVTNQSLRCKTRITYRTEPELPEGMSVVVWCAKHRTYQESEQAAI